MATHFQYLKASRFQPGPNIWVLRIGRERARQMFVFLVGFIGFGWSKLPSHMCILFCIHFSSLDAWLRSLGQLQFISCERVGRAGESILEPSWCSNILWDVYKQAMRSLATTLPCQRRSKIRGFSKWRWLSPAQSEAKCQAIPLSSHALRVNPGDKQIQKISNSLLS